jgi:hypothetical protein
VARLNGLSALKSAEESCQRHFSELRLFGPEPAKLLSCNGLQRFQTVLNCVPTRISSAVSTQADNAGLSWILKRHRSRFARYRQECLAGQANGEVGSEGIDRFLHCVDVVFAIGRDSREIEPQHLPIRQLTCGDSVARASSTVRAPIGSWRTSRWYPTQGVPTRKRKLRLTCRFRHPSHRVSLSCGGRA